MKNIEKLEKKNQDNKNKVEPLERYNIQIKGDFFNKKFVEFPLLTDFTIYQWNWFADWIDTAYNENDPNRIIPLNTVSFEFMFEGMPDWAVPMIKISPIITIPGFPTDEYPDYMWDNYRFNYIWEKVHNTNYRLYLYMFTDFTKGFSGERWDCKITLSAWFLNRNYYSTNQHNLHKTNG